MLNAMLNPPLELINIDAPAEVLVDRVKRALCERVSSRARPLHVLRARRLRVLSIGRLVEQRRVLDEEEGDHDLEVRGHVLLRQRPITIAVVRRKHVLRDGLRLRDRRGAARKKRKR